MTELTGYEQCKKIIVNGIIADRRCDEGYRESVREIVAGMRELFVAKWGITLEEVDAACEEAIREWRTRDVLRHLPGFSDGEGI